MIEEYELVIRLFSASLLGGLIGWEREKYNKPAGLRTNMLVCLGAALIMIFTENAFGASDATAPARVIAGVITGIGFLGAGTIMQSTKHIRGLTTAASMWVVAVIGMATGSGETLAAITATIFVLGILHFSRIEKGVGKAVETGLPIVTWLPLRTISNLSKKEVAKAQERKTRLRKLISNRKLGSEDELD